MPQTYLWGKSGAYWHALASHDPEYIHEERVSERMTALARRTNDNAPNVTYRVVTETKPGTGVSLCGLRGLALSEIGVDPDGGDALCPSCEIHAAK